MLVGQNGTLIGTNTQIYKYKYTNTQIHKYTNTQIHKYTNTQIHKYTNTQIHKYNTDTIKLREGLVFGVGQNGAIIGSKRRREA